MILLARRIGFYLLTALVAITLDFFIRDWSTDPSWLRLVARRLVPVAAVRSGQCKGPRRRVMIFG